MPFCNVPFFNERKELINNLISQDKIYQALIIQKKMMLTFPHLTTELSEVKLLLNLYKKQNLNSTLKSECLEFLRSSNKYLNFSINVTSIKHRFW